MRNDTYIEIVELHKNEIDMLRDLRTRFKFGEVTIIMRDGLPVRWKRITEFGEPGQTIDTSINLMPNYKNDKRNLTKQMD